MQVNKLETHDRLVYVNKRQDELGRYCQSIIDQRPFGDRTFYIFAHKRTIEPDEILSLAQSGQFPLDKIPTHRMIWQPRLSKPQAQENSMLFKAYPPSDDIKVIWIIPDREMWSQYDRGKMTESHIVLESIEAYLNDRRSLEAPEEDDATEAEAKAIYRDLIRQPVL